MFGLVTFGRTSTVFILHYDSETWMWVCTCFSLLKCKPTSLLTPDMVSGYVFIYGIYAFARQI